MSFRVNNGQLINVDSIDKKQNNKSISKKGTSNTFSEIFNQQINKNSTVKISSHAQQRLQQRNIVLNKKDIDNINNAIQKADSKGAKESLLLYKDMAFITSIKNKTIITAVDPKNTKENVFTNIDSAVIVNS